MMRVFITGATGRVGTRLVPKLLQMGHSVRMLARDVERAQPLRRLGAELILGNLLQPGTWVPGVSGADIVVHLAAFFRGATPEETHAVNLSGTMALAKASLDAGVSRFLFTSTNLVYGPGQDRLFREQDPPRPSSPYPSTKASAESELLALHRSNALGLRILRLAFVYGDGDPHLAEGLQWFRRWNPAQRMHLVHHADVAQAVMLAAETPDVDGRIYNVADDEPAAAGDIMRLHEEPIQLGAESRPIDAEWQQLVDTSKIRQELGYRPIYPSLSSAAAAGTL